MITFPNVVSYQMPTTNPYFGYQIPNGGFNDPVSAQVYGQMYGNAMQAGASRDVGMANATAQYLSNQTNAQAAYDTAYGNAKWNRANLLDQLQQQYMLGQMNDATQRYGIDQQLAGQLGIADRNVQGQLGVANINAGTQRYSADQNLAGQLGVAGMNMQGQLGVADRNMQTQLGVAGLNADTSRYSTDAQRQVQMAGLQNQIAMQQLANSGQLGVANVQADAARYPAELRQQRFNSVLPIFQSLFGYTPPSSPSGPPVLPPPDGGAPTPMPSPSSAPSSAPLPPNALAPQSLPLGGTAYQSWEQARNMAGNPQGAVRPPSVSPHQAPDAAYRNPTPGGGGYTPGGPPSPMMRSPQYGGGAPSIGQPPGGGSYGPKPSPAGGSPYLGAPSVGGWPSPTGTSGGVPGQGAPSLPNPMSGQGFQRDIARMPSPTQPPSYLGAPVSSTGGAGSSRFTDADYQDNVGISPISPDDMPWDNNGINRPPQGSTPPSMGMDRGMRPSFAGRTTPLPVKGMPRPAAPTGPSTSSRPPWLVGGIPSIG